MNNAPHQKIAATDTDAKAGPSPLVSRVPKYTFPAVLEEQEAQLRENELLRRFSESRRTKNSDPYRPRFHFVSPEGALNDPNGLCFWKGNWHLFYQGYPPEDPRQHWGHAVSPDLVHWTDLPYAIYPDPERAVFSGSAFVEDDRVLAMYHGPDEGNFVAVSSDPLLLNWEKLTGKAVIPIPHLDEDAPFNVFDPTLWKKGGEYYSLSAGKAAIGPGGRDVATGSLFRSTDLITWDYLHEFVRGDRFTRVNDDYACPYFLPIGDRHTLLFFSHATGGQYLLGDYDTVGDAFEVTDGGKFNFGAATPSGLHAPSAAPYGNGQVAVIFNMNPGKPTDGWDQIMTLPRILTLSDDGALGQEPVSALESLRSAELRLGSLLLPANEEVLLPSVEGRCLELDFELEPSGASMVELRVLKSPLNEEYTSIVFMRERGVSSGRDYRRAESPAPGGGRSRPSLISIDTGHGSEDPYVRPRAPETAEFPLGADENLHLRVFIDRSVVEVFINGRQALAVRTYPSREDATGVSLRSQGQASRVSHATAWQMRSIYEANR